MCPNCCKKNNRAEGTNQRGVRLRRGRPPEVKTGRSPHRAAWIQVDLCAGGTRWDDRTNQSSPHLASRHVRTTSQSNTLCAGREQFLRRSENSLHNGNIRIFISPPSPKPRTTYTYFLHFAYYTEDTTPIRQTPTPPNNLKSKKPIHTRVLILYDCSRGRCGRGKCVDNSPPGNRFLKGRCRPPTI